jgi:hypothetical protein
MATKNSNEWHTKDKLAQLASNAVSKFAPDLAQDFLLDVRRFAHAAVAENARKLGGQELVQLPGVEQGPTIATDPTPTAVN